MFYSYRIQVLISALILITTGCSTPFWATDNELFAPTRWQSAGAIRSRGLRPWERIERIAEKGKRAQKPDRKKVLVYQLIEEYNRSRDPLRRRAAIRSLGQITVNAPIEPALETLLSALHEESLGNRIAAVEALSTYGTEVKSENVSKARLEILSAFVECYHSQSYSSDAGSEKENNERKDFRLALLRGASRLNDSPQLIEFLAEAMRDEPLDDGALRLASMNALSKVTGKNYGIDYSLWSEYVDYRLGRRGPLRKSFQGFVRH